MSPFNLFFFTATYRSRNRRELTFASDPEVFDVQEVEKYIVGEFGTRACVFEQVCAHYAKRARSQPKPQMDWPDVFRFVAFSIFSICYGIVMWLKESFNKSQSECGTYFS